MKIIFMGTPEFACPTLEKILLDKKFDIVAILTKEPQVSGRGHKHKNSPIHDLALKNNLNIYTPSSLKNDHIYNDLSKLNPDIAVVVAYGLILPSSILTLPKYGCINLHPSILPRWRGASPIQRTIFAGDKITGVDIIQMDQGLDTGDILYRTLIELNGDETYKYLANKLSKIGSDAVVETLNMFFNNDFSKFKKIKQNNDNAIYADKISKKECQINWQEDAINIYRQIKALSGSLGCYFYYNNEKIKILDVAIVDNISKDYPIGSFINQEMLIQCNKGIIRPLIVQREGKNAITVSEFIRGFKFQSLH